MDLSGELLSDTDLGPVAPVRCPELHLRPPRSCTDPHKDASKGGGQGCRPPQTSAGVGFSCRP